MRVLLDGWGSARDGRSIATVLRAKGCDVRIYNRLSSLLIGRFSRNHRKILLVDDEVAFVGGINIGDENVDVLGRPSWADLALEIRGPQCRYLGQTIRLERRDPVESSLHIYLSGLGGGWRLRRRYLNAFASARERIHVAHGYFLPGFLKDVTPPDVIVQRVEAPSRCPLGCGTQPTLQFSHFVARLAAAGVVRSGRAGHSLALTCSVSMTTAGTLPSRRVLLHGVRSRELLRGLRYNDPLGLPLHSARLRLRLIRATLP